ncbi:MAG: hypothetical protein J6Y70_00485 [Bacilli bacterium]|nr:hypothetical protein [Bacilli bacterium]
MIQKQTLIRNWKKVNIVIGNGFDLRCGLKSKCSDYFKYNEKIYDYIKQWIMSFDCAYKTIDRSYIGRSFSKNSTILIKSIFGM